MPDKSSTSSFSWNPSQLSSGVGTTFIYQFYRPENWGTNNSANLPEILVRFDFGAYIFYSLFIFLKSIGKSCLVLEAKLIVEDRTDVVLSYQSGDSQQIVMIYSRSLWYVQ